jgi:hypothetical protein
MVGLMVSLLRGLMEMSRGAPVQCFSIISGQPRMKPILFVVFGEDPFAKYGSITHDSVAGIL